MSMTAKDFKAIAEAVKDARNAARPEADDRDPGGAKALGAHARLWNSLARSLADTLAKQSPKFQRARFLRDCGVES